MLINIFALFLTFQTLDIVSSEMMMNYFESKGEIQVAFEEAESLYNKTQDPYFLKKMFIYSRALGRFQEALNYGFSYLEKEIDFEVFLGVIPAIRNREELDNFLELVKNTQGDEDSLSFYSGYIYYLKGEYDKALVDFERARKYFSNVPIFISAYLDTLWRLGMKDQMVSFLDAMDSNFTQELGFLKGLYYRLLGEREKGLSVFTELYKVEGYRDERFLKVYLQLLDEEKMFEMGDTVVDELKRNNAFNWEIRKIAGIHNYYKGDLEGALEEFLVAGALIPGDPEIHYYLSRTLAGLGAFNDALDEIERAIKLSPYPEEYHYYQIYLLLNLGKVQDALRKIYILELKSRKDPYLFYLKGEALDLIGDKKNASNNYLNALILDSLNLKRYSDYLIHAKNNGIEVPFTYFLDKALIVSADREDSLYVSYLAMDIEQYAWVKDVLELLLNENSEEPVLLNNLAYALAQLGVDLTRALELVDCALYIMPNDYHFLDTKAWILFKLGRVEEAAEYIMRAAEFGGAEDPDVVKHRKAILGE
ncbi:MAG: hypothetical protein WBJ87_06595 [Candidatus Hydrothermia bacterium]